jgi:predicted DNA-binding transcriptional regulator AlpA
MKNKNAQPTPNASTTESPRIMTVADVAALLQIPRSSVYEKTRTRRSGVPTLPCRRVGRYLRFFEHEVMAWLVALPQNTPMRRRRERECTKRIRSPRGASLGMILRSSIAVNPDRQRKVGEKEKSNE